MVLPTDALESQLLTLPPADRARLVEVLLASLDTQIDGGPESDIEAAWIVEAERRLAELRSGTIAGIPAERVFADLRAKLAR